MAAAVALCVLAGGTPTAAAEPGDALHRLVDVAAQRLSTADPVAAYKWINGGPITDPARVTQVLDAVSADAVGRGIKAPYVQRVFTKQIDATEGIQYTRFAQWKFDPALAPTTAPDLSESRSAIDGYNQTMVDEIALHWDSLSGPQCRSDVDEAVATVIAERTLDPLYQQALTAATSSYCDTI
ncbi:MAG: chorismate mutase [Mycobacterium sp.]|nr:chorismate mutase [Mycobacterium sp.]